MYPHFPLAKKNSPVDQLRQACVDIAVSNELNRVAVRYSILPIFAGLFGSRAKGYNSLDSDYDFYVPYVDEVEHYLKAIDSDTSQVEGTESVPPQVTIEVMRSNKPISVQINLVPLKHFINEITRNNIDFRMALDNTAIRYCDQAAMSSFHKLAAAFVDQEKIKHMAIGRAAKVITILKKGTNIIKSEISDGVYRLLVARAMSNEKAVNALYYNQTQTFKDLLAFYSGRFGTTDETVKDSFYLMCEVVMKSLDVGDFDSVLANPETREIMVAVIEQAIRDIKKEQNAALPATATPNTVEARLSIVSQVNKIYARIVLRTCIASKLT